MAIIELSPKVEAALRLNGWSSRLDTSRYGGSEVLTAPWVEPKTGECPGIRLHEDGTITWLAASDKLFGLRTSGHLPFDREEVEAKLLALMEVVNEKRNG